MERLASWKGGIVTGRGARIIHAKKKDKEAFFGPYYNDKDVDRAKKMILAPVTNWEPEHIRVVEAMKL